MNLFCFSIPNLLAPHFSLSLFIHQTLFNFNFFNNFVSKQLSSMLLNSFRFQQHYGFINRLRAIQAHSQKFAMGGGCLGVLGAEPPAAGGQWGSGGEASSFRRLGVWGLSPQPPEARSLGVEPPALENFAFFCKNNFILGLFWLKNNAFKTWFRNWQCKQG